MKLLSFSLILLLSFSTLLDIQAFSQCSNQKQLVYSLEYIEIVNYYKDIVETYNPSISSYFYNLVLASSLNNELDLAFQYLDSCVIKGYTIDYFKSPFFKNLQNDQNWNKFIYKYDSLHNIYLQNKKKQEYITLNKMVDVDQQYASKKSKSVYDQYLTDSIYYKNGIRLYNMIITDSIPYVELFNFESVNIRSCIPWVLVRHYFGMVNRAKIYLDENTKYSQFYNAIKNDSSLYYALISLINKKRISPYLLKDGLEYSNSNDLFGKSGVFCYKIYEGGEIIFPDDIKKVKIIAEIYFKEGYSDSAIHQININRAKIRLPKYETEIKKMVYQDSMNNVLKENSKYWFEIINMQNTQTLYINNKNVRIVKANNTEGINIYFATDQKPLPPPQFISQTNLVSYRRYE